MITCSTFSIYLSKAAQGIKIENVKCIQARIVFELNFQSQKKIFEKIKVSSMKVFFIKLCYYFFSISPVSEPELERTDNGIHLERTWFKVRSFFGGLGDSRFSFGG